ncbi:MAG: hypothetical protein DRH50_10685 [Deltaproteobacteria bacterium]|nr:MAG: hypothetical protein DRH50_10685 [Deltaproteobacteria bacterium]
MRCRSFVTPENVVLGIHEKISALSARVKKYRYMGTTLSVLLLCERTAHIIHVGDSRIYRLRAGDLEQLTEVSFRTVLSFSGMNKSGQHPH